ncbi:MAG: hypothetical protein ACYDAR_14825, partial [Thermomicrobiales bacterium]
MSAQKAHETETSTSAVADAPSGTIRRRGLIAGAAALAAGLLATQSSEPVAAGGNSTALTMGLNDDLSNTPTVTTTMFVTGTTGGGLRVKNSYATGTVADTTRDAVQGYASNPSPNPPPIISNSGVHGRNDDLNGIGTTGVASNGTGTYGQSTSGSGVGGSSSSGSGVYGASSSGPGVYGTSVTNHGVSGFASGTGTSFITAGLFGTSNTTYGIIGNTTAAGYSGLTGTTSTAGVAALAGTALVTTAYAAYFSGKTVVEGDFYVVKHADGSG